MALLPKAQKSKLLTAWEQARQSLKHKATEDRQKAKCQAQVEVAVKQQLRDEVLTHTIQAMADEVLISCPKKKLKEAQGEICFLLLLSSTSL